jgi:putative membrane-bound dehydrogenase-like protein
MKTRPRFFIIVLFLLAIPGVWSQLPPDKALKSFKVSPGLEISLWASEPLFVNPTCMDIDHKGRVWVCESVNYRSKLHGRKLRRPEGDRILILEDSKGTGKADKVTVFYQSPDTLAPLGIAVAPDPDGPGCKVYVCQSPDILLFEDKDGDGKADGPPKKLLTGFGGYDHDHGVHGILIGPDNKLYVSVGDQGVRNLVDKNGKKWTTNQTDCRAGTIWRCDLDGKNLELLAHNFRNEYEPCVDIFGTIFVSDNDDDGNQQTRICYVMPGGNYGYWPRGPGQTHWHEEQPGVVPKILRTYFGSPTGMCVYEGDLLPKKYHNQLLHTDAGPRHVRCYHLTPQGAGYKVQREDMVESTDNWFRPSDVCVAPDGSVYVADWYDPGVGGHGMGDTTRGRVYRIAPKGHKPSVPKIDLTTAKGFFAALDSPCLCVRAMAMAKALTRTVPADKNLGPQAYWIGNGRDPKAKATLRARVLWLLAGHGAKQRGGWVVGLARYNLLAGALTDPDPRFRCLALRIVKDFFGESITGLAESSGMPEFEKLAKKIINDPSPQVRREVLLTLRDEKPEKAKPLIYELAKQYDGKDRFYLAAVGIAVGHHDAKRREIILADFAKHFPEWNEKVAGLAWELRPPGIFPLLEKQLLNAKVSAGQRSQIVSILASSTDAGAAAVLLKALQDSGSRDIRDDIVSSLTLNLAGKWRKLRESKELAGAIEQLLQGKETRQAGLALIAAAQRADFLAKVMALAKGKGEPSNRLTALQTLGSFKSAEATATLADQLLRDPKLAIEAARALGRQGTPDAMKALQTVAISDKGSLDLRQAAVAGLAGTRPGTTWLLEAHGKKQLTKDLLPDLARLLRYSPYPDLRNKALIAFPPPAKLDPKKLPSIPALLARKGNADRGKQLMLASLKNDVKCLTCHTINKVGGNVGPDLSVIGSKASRENLLESILYPSRAIADQYVSWIVRDKNGLSITGLIIEDVPGHILLRDATAKDHKISRKEIDSKIKSRVSIMPDDLIMNLPEHDLVDMVEYLYSLKSPAFVPGEKDGH